MSEFYGNVFGSSRADRREAKNYIGKEVVFDIDVKRLCQEPEKCLRGVLLSVEKNFYQIRTNDSSCFVSNFRAITFK